MLSRGPGGRLIMNERIGMKLLRRSVLLCANFILNPESRERTRNFCHAAECDRFVIRWRNHVCLPVWVGQCILGRLCSGLAVLRRVWCHSLVVCTVDALRGQRWLQVTWSRLLRPHRNKYQKKYFSFPFPCKVKFVLLADTCVVLFYTTWSGCWLNLCWESSSRKLPCSSRWILGF